MQIVDLRADNQAAIDQLGRLLVEDFATDFPDSWSDSASQISLWRNPLSGERSLVLQ